MRRIAVVVHAESQHHVDRLVGGWFDSSLTEHGREQARRVGLALQEVFLHPQVPIVSSDLLRARETAEIVGEVLGSSVVLEPGLRELSYGAAEGQPQAWLNERIVPTPTHGTRLDHRVCEGAESRRDIATRVYAAMNGILTADKSDLVIVTHGFAATFVMAWWIGLPIESTGYVSFEVSPAGISLLVEHDAFRNRSISRLNDTRHLD